MYSLDLSPFADRYSSSIAATADGFSGDPHFARIRSVERFIARLPSRECAQWSAEPSPSNCKVTSIRTRSNETTPKKSQKYRPCKLLDFAETGAHLDTRSLNYQFGEFTLDVVRGCVLKAGEEIKLRPKVYETLKYLVEHPGQLIGKQELMQAVWPDSFVTDDSLVQCTLELRRALDDRSQQLLKTVPRRGYLFTAEVIQRATKPDPLPATDPFDLSERS